MKVHLKRGRPSKETSKPKEKLHAVADGPMILSESDRESKVSCKRKWKSVDDTENGIRTKCPIMVSVLGQFFVCGIRTNALEIKLS